MKPAMAASDDQKIRQLFDDYLRMYSSRDDQLTTCFSENFSGFTGGGDFLVKDREEWVAITRQDFTQIKDPIRIELKDLTIQSLADTVAVATSFFTIHLPIKDHILSRETARLVLIFRKEAADWKISHSSISIPYHLVRAGEIYPLQELVERNQYLEELIAERTLQLSDKLQKLEAATETISWLARTDELTGLHNRRSFNEIFALELSAARRHGYPLSLISIDLDHFKTVNDTFGHSVGDLVLKEFAGLMLKMVREEDVSARWGGEEFIILLAHTAGDAAAAVAERMRSSFAQNPGSAAPLPMTASFGVAQLQDGEEADALIRRADEALYRAKQEGRNRVVWGGNQGP